MEGFPGTISIKFCRGQRIAKVHSGEEILPKSSTPEVGCTNVTDKQTIDDRQIDGFTTAKTRT